MKNDNLIVAIGIIALIVLVFGGFGGMMSFRGANYGYGFGGMMNMMYGSYGYGMMLFGWIYGILVLVALVFLIIWLARQLRK